MPTAIQTDDVIARIVPRRSIFGSSAVLMPVTSDGRLDWEGFAKHLKRTADFGLIPAVNMDTGYVNLLTCEDRQRVLQLTQEVLGSGQFLAGAFVADSPNSQFDLDAYRAEIEQILEFGGTPVIFQSHGLVNQSESAIVASYKAIAEFCPSFYAFELGSMFAPFGSIYSLEVYEELLSIPNCLGAKHSSLDRQQEWQRLDLRDRVRPDFRVLTGNDLAIDMVMYGSDYLLGLSTFAPDYFALRDRMWCEGDASFYEVNDVLQYLGFFAFRNPVPAYKHSAAQFLKLRGWIDSDNPHPKSDRRPASDVPILQEILQQLLRFTADQ